jgi:tetratricopeptide (TPR) repeat protein
MCDDALPARCLVTEDRFKTGGGLDRFKQALDSSKDSLTGQTFGNYRITGLIAEGGMGRVYRAVRDDGEFDREVAIKILPPGMGKEHIQRFKQERQILASLSHPNIGQLFDAGLADSGSLYLVMELIDGMPIDEFARHRKLSPGAKTRLMLSLCEALAFAHSKLVVHRDLKPSNVFVTENSGLKLLDFGIAKILEADENVTVASRPMTPRYASPEQLLNEPISVSSDIYQIGLLFLSLFEQRDDVEAETQASATERAVRKTSVTVESRISERLPPELVAIINKCLRAEAVERYESAGELATDLRNYLGGFPVAARNPGWWDRTSKFLSRNATASITVAVLVSMLLVGNFVYLHALSRSRAAAELEAEKAAEVTEFLIGLFESNDPDQASGEELTARQILEAGAARVKQELERQPDIRAAILHAIGRIFLSTGDWDRSISNLEASLAIQQSLYGDDDPRLADTYRYLAMVRHEAQDQSEEAQAYFAKAIELHRRAYGEDIRYARLLTESSVLVMFVDEDYARAVSILEQALAIHDRELSADDPERIYTYQQLLRAHERLGEFEVAQRYGENAVRIAEQTFGADHARVSAPAFYLSRVMESQGQYAEAAVLMARVLEIDKRVYGEFDNRTGDTHLNLAHMLRMSGRLDEAIVHAERSVEVMRVALGKNHSQYATALTVLGRARQEAGDYAEAETVLRDALRIIEEEEGPEHTFTAYALMLYGTLLAHTGRYEQAIPVHQRALDIWTAVVGPGKPDSAKVELVLGQDHLWAGELDQAEALLLSALRTNEAALPDDHLRLADNLISVGELYTIRGSASECRQPIERGLDIRLRRLPADHVDVALAKGALAACLLLGANPGEARTLLSEASTILEGNASAPAKRVQALYSVLN